MHEAVLFGSGEDFNGMSALLDGLYSYPTRGLRQEDLAIDASLCAERAPPSPHCPAALSLALRGRGRHCATTNSDGWPCWRPTGRYSPRPLPRELMRPLTNTGPDVLFDESVSQLLRRQLGGGGGGTETQPSSGLQPPPTGAAVGPDTMAYWLVAHALGCERAHLALGAQQLLRWRARGEPREQCKVAAHFLLHAAEKAIDETAWASSLCLCFGLGQHVCQCVSLYACGHVRGRHLRNQGALSASTTPGECTP